MELLCYPSISADPAHQADVQRCAAWLAVEMEQIGFQNCRVIPTGGQPVAYGEWLDAGPERPTVLVYAHYDVQPVDPLELWESPPFEPTVRDGKLYARGAIDDKSGVFVNLKAFEAMLRANQRLPFNVKLFFEGEEETGSLAMEPFVLAHSQLLQANLMVISDGAAQPNEPQIFCGARGVVDAEVIVTGPQRDLRSGSYGGVIHNPVHLVGQMISGLHDATGRVQIPGFYEAVCPLKPGEEEMLALFEPQLIARATHETGIKNFWAESLGPYAVRATALPTCDVNGVWGGYQGPGSKTIIPAKAGFKVSMRLVPNQDPRQILQQFTNYMLSFACDTLDVQVIPGAPSWAATLLRDGPIVEALQQAYEATWGKRALVYREGGSVPIMGMFQRRLNIPMVSLPCAVGDNAHAPNEYLFIDDFYRSIQTALHFYYRLDQIL